MPPISVLIKPASGNCDMSCEYCFYHDIMQNRNRVSYGMMKPETLKEVIKKLLQHAGGSCTIAYQGGEPTLCGLDFFEKSVEFQNKYNVNKVRIYNAFQTNGYSLNREWGDFFIRNHFLAGISLDGNREIHDYYRKSRSGGGTFDRIMDNIALFQKMGVEFNILSVVNKKSAASVKNNYEFFKRNKLNYLQFIPCLDPQKKEWGQEEYSLTPKDYGSFLVELFGMWYKDLQHGTQPYIRQFENYIGMLLGIPAESCDMRGRCSTQYVVEADGTVYPCDFYVTDEWKLGDLHTDTIEDIDKRREELEFISRSYALEDCCKECKYLPLCRGGCRRSRIEARNNHQYFCESYKMFFENCLPELMNIAEHLKYRR